MNEFAQGPVHFNNDRLECLYFNPISRCNTVISRDIDQDSNFLNLISKCSYFNEPELNNLTSINQRPLGGYVYFA